MRKITLTFLLSLLNSLVCLANWSSPIQKATASSSSAVTTQTVSFGSTPTVGQIVIVGIVSNEGNCGIEQVTDNQARTRTEVVL